jgi:hypothetical protein
MNKVNPLQTGRFYKVKNPRKSFLCALCSAPRSMQYSKNLSGIKYLQIIVMSVSTGWLLFPLMGVKAVLLAFPIWMLVEVANKLLYRKEVACPYCGFDATWYRRDVKVANKIVKEFWKQNYPGLAEDKNEVEESEEKAMNPQANLNAAPQQDDVI